MLEGPCELSGPLKLIDLNDPGPLGPELLGLTRAYLQFSAKAKNRYLKEKPEGEVWPSTRTNREV